MNNASWIDYLRESNQERLIDAIIPMKRTENHLSSYNESFQATVSSADVDFTTKREVHQTVRSHVNAVVLDSKWEQSAAFYLESMVDVVRYYVAIPSFFTHSYEYEGVQHHYEPDFIVRLNNDINLILETKGYEDDQDRAKHQAAKRWCEAVNNWGKLKRWEFLVCKDPGKLRGMLKELV
jgi:type III restriction enzyme